MFPGLPSMRRVLAARLAGAAVATAGCVFVSLSTLGSGPLVVQLNGIRVGGGATTPSAPVDQPSPCLPFETVVPNANVASSGSTTTNATTATCTAPTLAPTPTATPTPPPTTTTDQTSTATVSNTSHASGVFGISTSTPNTGADTEFGIGLLLVVLGGGVTAGAGRLRHRRG